MESTGRFLEAGLVELNWGGREGGREGGGGGEWRGNGNPRGSWLGVILTTNLL